MPMIGVSKTNQLLLLITSLQLLLTAMSITQVTSKLHNIKMMSLMFVWNGLQSGVGFNRV